jgi:hypothetical protein
MSKKSRRRNRKILGALAAGLGAAALMRGRGTPAAANVDSGRGGDSASAVARAIANTPKGTNYPGENKVVVADTSPKPVLNVTGGIHAGKPAKGMLIKSRNQNRVTGVDAPPSILNPYSEPVVPKGRLWTRSYKSGGRVKGAGKAKRGLGRAFTKANK